MWRMEERSRLLNDKALHDGIHQQFPVIEQGGNFPAHENGSVLMAVAHELAMAGDELTRRSSVNETKNDMIWDNVKRYAIIATFRLLFGLV